MLVMPLIANDLALSHLPKQMGAAAGGMLLFASDPKTRTHDATFILAAFPHPNTTQSCLRQTAIVMRKFEMCFRLPRLVVRAKTKVLIHPVGKHQLAGIHFPIRVPKRFESAKRLHQLGAEHFWQELGARLTISMLAGERAAVGKHQVGCIFHEPAEFLDALCRFKIEAETIVNAAVAEVSVQCVSVLVGLSQLAQVTQI